MERQADPNAEFAKRRFRKSMTLHELMLCLYSEGQMNDLTFMLAEYCHRATRTHGSGSVIVFMKTAIKCLRNIIREFDFFKISNWPQIEHLDNILTEL